MKIDGELRHGLVTDDNQMTLFATEGIIRALVRQDRGLGFTVAVTQHAFDRWLDTQLLPEPDGERDGWLIQQQWLYSRRAPGNTCLSALQEARKGQRTISPFGELAANNSKGCGGVMRSAPFGLLQSFSYSGESSVPAAVIRDEHLRKISRYAAESAGYPHGHITGRLASGALATLIGAIIAGQGLLEAVDTMMRLLAEHPGHEETTVALEKAIAAAKLPPSVEIAESLGGAWVAEEALAIAVWAALVYPDADQIRKALTIAVTHSGDSDSTGAICGNILGALHGDLALPVVLAFEVEGREVILAVADDLVYEVTAGNQLHSEYRPFARWKQRYPGW